MFHVEKQSGDKEKSYQLLLKQLEAMTEDETDAIANYANASALVPIHYMKSTGRGFTSLKRASSCSDRFKDFLPVCAFRSAEAYAALPTLMARCSGLPM